MEERVSGMFPLWNREMMELFKECHEKGGEKRMETESLISYLYQVKGYIESGSQNLQVGPIREIVNALRRSEKDRGYRKQAEMWRELKSIIKSGEVYTLLPGVSNMGIQIDVIVKAFELIEKKYSSKPDEKTVKLLKNIDREVRALLRELGGI